MTFAAHAVRWMLACGASGLVLASPTLAACGDALPAGTRLQAEADPAPASGSAGWQLAFAPRPAPVPVGRHFALDIVLCAPAGQALPATLAVDADMPAHRHGMNYRATVRALGRGRYLAEGLMFHMPGRWRVRFELPAVGDQPALRLARGIEVR